MNRRAAYLLAVVLVAAGPTQAAPAPGVQARLVQVPVLRGEFVQEKHVAGFQRPLRSSGRFLLVRGRGLAWDTREPFASEAVLAQGQLSSRTPDGRRTLLLDGASSPGAAAATALLLALLGGDLQVLEADFVLQESVDDERWSLSLTPRPGPMQSAFRRLRLAGDRHVRDVEIEEANGDRTMIRFDAIEDAPAPTADEDARLG